MTTENMSSSPIIPITDLPPPISDPVVVPAIIYPTVAIDGEYQVTTYENGVEIKEFYNANIPTVTSTESSFTHLIDIGAFFDRFGDAKFQILTSSDATIKALLLDVTVRKWIDLRRPDVEQALNIISTKCDKVTPELIQAILHTPVEDIENLSLRKLYFGA